MQLTKPLLGLIVLESWCWGYDFRIWRPQLFLLVIRERHAFSASSSATSHRMLARLLHLQMLGAMVACRTGMGMRLCLCLEHDPTRLYVPGGPRVPFFLQNRKNDSVY